MQFGRSYEEFEVGAVYKHWPGKTVTEYDDHLFCLLTMNHHPLHLDTHYAQETTQFGKNVVVGNYIYSILLGMSVPDVSGKAIANLEIESLRHVAPDLPRRHDLRRDRRARQVGVEVEGRPRRGLRRDQGLQAGRHRRLPLPPQGDGPEEHLPGSPGWGTAWPPHPRPTFEGSTPQTGGSATKFRRPNPAVAGLTPSNGGPQLRKSSITGT
jgi:hypothetical protein